MGKFLGLWEAEHPDYKITPLAAPKAGDGTRYGTNKKAYASPEGLIVTTANKHRRRPCGIWITCTAPKAIC